MDLLTLNESLEDRNYSHVYNSSYYTSLDWILPISFEIVLIIATLWILLSLLHFGIKTGKWSNAGRRNSEKLSNRHIYTAVIFCAVGCIFHPIVGISYMSVGFNGEDGLCEALGDLAPCAYGFVSLAVLMLFWLRQRAFFTNRMLNVKYSKPVRCFSAVSIVGFYTAGGAVLLFVTIPYNQRSGPDGCLYIPTDEQQIGYLVSVFLTLVVGEISLLALFIYAIVKSGKDITLKDICCTCFDKTFGKICCCPFESDHETTPTARNSWIDRRNTTMTRSISTSSLADDPDVVRTILVKTLLVAVLTFLLDFIFQAYVFYIADRNSHRRFSIIYGSAHLFLRLLFVVLSFANVKKMLFSFCVHHKKQKYSVGK